MPVSVPGEFTVRLGEGGSINDLADEMAGWELGVEAAAAGLLSWLEWVEVEVRGFDDLVEGLHRLRGAVMVAAAVVGQERGDDDPIEVGGERDHPVEPIIYGGW